MASETDVANIALGRLRVGQTISDITDQDTKARTCLRFMEFCRHETLRAFPWGFSLKAQALAEVADQTFPGWTYVYAYPDDCLMVRAVADEGGIRSIRQSVFRDSWDQYGLESRKNPFQIALKDDGASKVILSDVPDAYAFFTYDVTGIGLWPSDAVSTYGDRLAMEVGGPLQADSGVIQAAQQRYFISIANAAAQSLNESADDPRPESPSISCRY